MLGPRDSVSPLPPTYDEAMVRSRGYRPRRTASSNLCPIHRDNLRCLPSPTRLDVYPARVPTTTAASLPTLNLTIALFDADVVISCPLAEPLVKLEEPLRPDPELGRPHFLAPSVGVLRPIPPLSADHGGILRARVASVFKPRSATM